jgi:hypothetical protein
MLGVGVYFFRDESRILFWWLVKRCPVLVCKSKSKAMRFAKNTCHMGISNNPPIQAE